MNNQPPIDDDAIPARRPAPDEITVTHTTTHKQRKIKNRRPTVVYDPEIEKQIVSHQIQVQEESWIKGYWRPAVGWLYILICFMDFVAFPALTMILPVITGVVRPGEYEAWQSLTATNGGLIHIAFGAILGVAAWSRGKEKIAGANN